MALIVTQTCGLQSRPHSHLWSVATVWLDTPVIECLVMIKKDQIIIM